MFNVLDKITTLRKANHMSVYALAQQTGISQSTIATWYAKSLLPPIDKLEKICEVFDISLSAFFQTSDDIAGITLDSEELILLSRWKKLAPKERAAVLALLNELSKK